MALYNLSHQYNSYDANNNNIYIQEPTANKNSNKEDQRKYIIDAETSHTFDKTDHEH